MAITVTFSLDEKTVRMLAEIASSGSRSEKLRELIEREHCRLFSQGDESATALPAIESLPEAV